MTIEQAPSTNGRTASEQTYAPPAAPSRRMTVEHPREVRRRRGMLRLVMPMLFAVAIALVVRGLAEAGHGQRDNADAAG